MKNVEYYILAYSMLIYLFIEKYITLLYLLFKVHFVDENKNVEFAVNEYGKRYQKFNHYKELPNVQVTQFCRLYPKDAVFRVDICMTDKYILIHLNKINDFLFKNNGYEDILSRYIFSKRDYRGEKSGETLEELAVKNLQYYFEKKNAIVYTKQFNSDSGRSSRFLYRNTVLYRKEW